MSGLGNGYTPGRFVGFDGSNGTNPLDIRTNGLTRMRINGAQTAFGVNTSGFIGIGTNVPAAPIHIVGTQASTGSAYVSKDLLFI